MSEMMNEHSPEFLRFTLFTLDTEGGHVVEIVNTGMISVGSIVGGEQDENESHEADIASECCEIALSFEDSVSLCVFSIIGCARQLGLKTA